MISETELKQKISAIFLLWCALYEDPMMFPYLHMHHIYTSAFIPSSAQNTPKVSKRPTYRNWSEPPASSKQEESEINDAGQKSQCLWGKRKEHKKWNGKVSSSVRQSSISILSVSSADFLCQLQLRALAKVAISCSFGKFPTQNTLIFRAKRLEGKPVEIEWFTFFSFPLFMLQMAHCWLLG